MSTLGMEAGGAVATEAVGAAGGPAGIAAATALVAVAGAAIFGAKSLSAFAAGVDSTASRLGQYNGMIAGAQANAQAQQTIGDIGRGQLLSKELSDFVTQQSSLSNRSQDELALILKPLVPVLTSGMATLEAWLQAFEPTLIKVLNWAIDKFNEANQAVFDKLPDWWKNDKVPLHLQHIDEQTRKDEGLLFDLANAAPPGLDQAVRALRDLADQMRDGQGLGGPRPAFGGM